MDTISDWFKGSKDYYEGVAIYASLPIKKTQILRTLNKGKSRRNMSQLVSLLRQYKNGVIKPADTKKEIVLPKKPPKPVTQETINQEVEKRAVADKVIQREFSGVRIGDLPPELRPRYFEAKNIFFEMIELKFVLNDLPDEAENDALKIQLQIESLDEARDLIWAEIRHWERHKTLLSTGKKDFTNLDKYQLDLKRRNLESSKNKMQKRVDAWYEALDTEQDSNKKQLLENKINKAEKALHQKQVDINTIKKLL